MALNRGLIDTIKKNFAKKATEELHDIVLVHDLDRWSEEAFVAAREILTDREAGRAKAPRVPEKEQPPPSIDEHLDSLFSLATFGAAAMIGGVVYLPGSGDYPIAFGSNVAWFAVETKDTAAVASILNLRQIREARWVDGIAAAHRSSVFVTPPLGDWTLAVGTSLLIAEKMDDVVKPLLEELSSHFQDAQYFCTRQGTELYAWARAQNGQLLRGYGWLGQRSLVLWNEGPETKQERTLRFRFTADSSEPDRGEGPLVPNEVCVFRLAALWSINPKTLEEQSAEPARGLLGDIPRRQNQVTRP
jgi:hypothetical protein